MPAVPGPETLTGEPSHYLPTCNTNNNSNNDKEHSTRGPITEFEVTDDYDWE